ncbi:MAG: ATP-dependent metallopeptidase FtsH/Yme1/Tma family protein, partial [Sedimenticolaceae bacterium]
MAKNLILWVIIAIVLMSVFSNFNTQSTRANVLPYSDFIAQVKEGMVRSVNINGQKIEGTLTVGGIFSTYSPGDDGLVGDLLSNQVQIVATPPETPSILKQILISWFPLFILIGLWIFFMRQMPGGGGGRGAMSFGKSKARMLSEDQVTV